MALSDTLEQLCSTAGNVNRREFLKGLGIAAIAASGLNTLSAADSSKGHQSKKYNVFKFYLDPRLISNMEFVKKVLPKYVGDMNHILSKNTNLVLVFDPETDIIPALRKPYSSNFYGKLPTKDFEIWAHVLLSDKNYSHEGYAHIDESGAAAIGALKWREIYDPDKVENNFFELRDYWVQIDHMLHELAHIFEVGSSGYHSLSVVDDTTGIQPRLDIRLSNPNDSYWKNKSDYKTDPVLGNIMRLITKPLEDRPKTRKELLETVQYSNLTAAIINGEYRGKEKSTIPSLENMKLKVIDKNNSQPLGDAAVKIFRIRSFPPYKNTPLVNRTTDDSGELIFDWGTSEPFNNYEHLRLIKVIKEGYKPQAKYISTFDLQEAKLLHNKDIFNVDIQLIAE